jgi:phenylacetate-CoA ligase
LMPRPELEQLQLERLQSFLVRLTRNVRRCREQIADVRVKSLDDMAHLPFTTPDDMAQSFPYGMFALPLRRVVRVHSTIGAGGNRVVVGHTRNDLAQWGRLVARQLVACGLTANDVVQVCLGRDLQRGGAGYALGAELIEASMIAEEPTHVDVQVSMLQTYRPTTIITTPTNALDLAQALEARKIDSPSLHLRTVLLTRPVDSALREQLASLLLVEVQSNFGIDQILDPGFCVECEEGHFHVNEDQFLVEVQDGELVVTTLCREALPLLRYRTRRACRIVHEKCPCTRTGAILIPGDHLDGRLRVNETTLYERQIAEVLNRSRAAGHPFSFEAAGRRLIVSIEVTESLLSDMMRQMVDWRRELEEQFLIHLGVEAEVQFVAPQRQDKA